jgi:HAD superfamily hydrolase (TIGR01509 family)
MANGKENNPRKMMGLNPEKQCLKVVVFDCDGVIFDSKEANISFYKNVIEIFGRHPMTDDEMRYIHISTMEEAIKRLFPGDARIKDIIAYCEKIDLSPYMEMTRIEPGLKEILAKIKTFYRTAIATNRGKDIHLSLRRFEIENAFDMVVSAMDVSNPKPDPEALNLIMKRFGCIPSEVIFIGDSEVDWETSVRAGVFFIAFKNKKIQAHYYIDNLSELLEYLKIS